MRELPQVENTWHDHTAQISCQIINYKSHLQIACKMDQMTIWMFGSGRLPCLELKCTFSILVHKVHNFNIIHFHIFNITHFQYYTFAHFQYYTLNSQYFSRSGGRKSRILTHNFSHFRKINSCCIYN